jgi:hypothetical protein
MRSLLVVGIFFISFVASAGEQTWYVMNKFDCTLSNGAQVSRNQSGNTDLVISTLGFMTREFYLEGTHYDHDSNFSLIEFTGHRPSAGPSIDPLETSYSMRFTGLLPIGKSVGIEGEIYRNVAYSGWVRMPETVKCNVVVKRTF